MNRLALAALFALSLAACVGAESTDAEVDALVWDLGFLRLPISDNGTPVDCANADGGRHLRLWVASGAQETPVHFAGCDAGVVLASPAAGAWTHLRLEVALGDGSSWNACPGVVELEGDEDTYAFDIGSACD